MQMSPFRLGKLISCARINTVISQHADSPLFFTDTSYNGHGIVNFRINSFKWLLHHFAIFLLQFRPFLADAWLPQSKDCIFNGAVIRINGKI